MEDTYNGWTNRETWATNLYIDNDEGLQNECRDMAIKLSRRHDDDEEKASEKMTEWLQNYMTTLLDYQEYRYEFGTEQTEGLRLMAKDIGSLYRVNWQEIADLMVQEVFNEVTA